MGESWFCIPTMMRCGFFLALAVLFQVANCFPKYSSLDSNGYSSDYKSDPKCKYVDDIEYDEKCEPYTDKVCYTHHEEMFQRYGDCLHPEGRGYLRSHRCDFHRTKM